MILSDISSGNTGTADIAFLVALIVFCLALLAMLPMFAQPPDRPFYRVLVAIGLACLALGWLVL